MIYVVGALASAVFAYLATQLRTDTAIGKIDSSRRWLMMLFMVLSFLPLFILSAIRNNVGTDYKYYVQMYEHPEWYENHAPVFDCFFAILRFLTDNTQVFFVLTSLWICAGYYWSIFKFSDFPAYSVLLFVVTEDYFVSMNIVRQYMAIAVLLIFLNAFRDLNWKKLIPALLVAGMLHTSSFIVILLVILQKFFRISPVKAFMAGIGILILGKVALPMIQPLIEEFTPFGKYFYNRYSTEWFGPTIPMFGIYICILGVLSLLTDLERAKKDPMFRLLYHAVTINYWIMALSLCMPANFYRLTYYCNAFFVICFPVSLKYMRKPWLKWAIGTACIVLYTIWTVLLLRVGNQDVIPYRTIFS